MTRSFLLGLTLGLGALPASSAAPLPETEPWGYVYVFRTLQVYPLTEEDNRLGRLPENQISLTSPRVSRRHAAIRRTNQGVELVDVGSSNGSRVNGEELRAREPVRLEPGDRIQLADELLLYHQTLDGLRRDELRLRLLSSIVKLNVDLPQDYTKKSLGREEVVSVHSEALLKPGTATAELTHSVDRIPEVGFPKETPAFVGNVLLDDGILELSLWALESGGSMTSRRASISRLKHTTLKIAVEDEPQESDGDAGGLRPWFPPQDLIALFDVFPEARDISLRFATSLASQDRPVALRDAAETLAFRHEISSGDEWELLVLAAQSGGGWVEASVVEKRRSLTDIDRQNLAKTLAESRARLERARALGAQGKSVADAESVIERAAKRLASLNAE